MDNEATTKPTPEPEAKYTDEDVDKIVKKRLAQASQRCRLAFYTVGKRYSGITEN